MRKITVSKKLLVFTVLIESAILLGLAMYWVLSPSAYVLDPETGCRIYNSSHITSEIERTENTPETPFGASDLRECVTEAESIHLEPWSEQLLVKMNQSDDLEYATFEEMIAERRYSEDKYTANQDLTIVPLYSSSSVLWICPQEITCTWAPETLGHSTVLYYENGVPKVSAGQSTF